MTYREIYEIETGVKLPQNFEVHHIDFDRNNNVMRNLVAMPKSLHANYHKFLEFSTHTPHDKIISLTQSGRSYNSFWFHGVSEFIKHHEKACMWADYRDFLLGFVPNIHNLTY